MVISHKYKNYGGVDLIWFFGDSQNAPSSLSTQE